MSKAEKLIVMLVEGLEEASDCLDYCGYGDSWERECAYHNGSPEKIEAALKAGQEYIDALKS